MFDMSFGEMILLAAIALIAIGPKQLPDVARTVGKLLGELKKAVGDVTSTVANARDETDRALRSVTDDISKFSTEIRHDVQSQIDSAFKVEDLPPHPGNPPLQEDVDAAEAVARELALRAANQTKVEDGKTDGKIAGKDDGEKT